MYYIWCLRKIIFIPKADYRKPELLWWRGIIIFISIITFFLCFFSIADPYSAIRWHFIGTWSFYNEHKMIYKQMKKEMPCRKSCFRNRAYDELKYILPAVSRRILKLFTR